MRIAIQTFHPAIFAMLLGCTQQHSALDAADLLGEGDEPSDQVRSIARLQEVSAVDVWPADSPEASEARDRLLGDPSERISTQNFPQVYWIVGVGDSYAAGQGNPAKPAAPPKDEDWGDYEPCHRSSENGTAKAAQRLLADFKHDIDEHRLVIHHKSFACSGAVTAHLMGQKQKPDDLTMGKPSQDPQLAQVKAFALSGPDFYQSGAKQIDALVMSIGGNDVGFGAAVELCALGNCDSQLLAPVCTNLAAVGAIFLGGTVLAGALGGPAALVACASMLGDREKKLERGLKLFESDAKSKVTAEKCACAWHNKCPPGRTQVQSIVEVHRTLEDRYKCIDLEIDALESPREKELRLIKNVYLTEYPSPFYDSSGKFCDGAQLLASDWFVAGISAQEASTVRNKLFVPLNKSVAGTSSLGWKVIGGLASASKNHGFCSSDPFFNTNATATQRQGVDIGAAIPFVSSGMLHPNDKGYELYGRRIADALHADVEQKVRLGAPDKPLRPVLSEIGPSSVTLTWDDRSSREDYFKVQVFPPHTGPGKLGSLPKFEKNCPDKANRCVLSKANVPDDFSFRVVACSRGEKPECPDVAASDLTMAGVTIPNRPAILDQAAVRATPIKQLRQPEPIQRIDFYYEDASIGETGIIVAWASIPATIDDAALHDYLAGPDVKVHYETRAGANDDATGTASFRPKPEDALGGRFMVTLRQCNLAGCSEWATPKVLKSPQELKLDLPSRWKGLPPALAKELFPERLPCAGPTGPKFDAKSGLPLSRPCP